MFFLLTWCDPLERAAFITRFRVRPEDRPESDRDSAIARTWLARPTPSPGARRGALDPAALADVQAVVAPTERQVEDWINHPDERVAWELAVRRLDLLADDEDAGQDRLRAKLVESALRSAQATGHAWTPLLDAIVCRPGPSCVKAWRDALYRALGPPPYLAQFPDMEPFRPFKRWGETVSDPDEVAPLYRFWSDCIGNARVVILMRILPDEAAHFDEIWRRAPQGLGHEPEPAEIDGDLVAGLWHHVAARLFCNFGSGASVGGALTAAGYQPPAFVLDAVIARLRVELGADDPPAGTVAECARFLATTRAVPDEALEMAFEVAVRTRHGHRTLLERPDLPDAIVRRFWHEFPRSRIVRAYVARHRLARVDGAIYANLRDSRAPEVHVALCERAVETSDPAELRRLFPHLRSLSGPSAVGFVESLSSEWLAALGRPAVTALLHDAEADVRRRALAVIGRLDGR
jgi:hypothetical protein